MAILYIPLIAEIQVAHKYPVLGPEIYTRSMKHREMLRNIKGTRKAAVTG